MVSDMAGCLDNFQWPQWECCELGEKRNLIASVIAGGMVSTRRTHTHAHTHTHTHQHTGASQVHTCTHTVPRTHSVIRTHTHTHWMVVGHHRLHTHTHTHTPHTHTQCDTHTQDGHHRYTHTHTVSHARTHTHTHTEIHAHTLARRLSATRFRSGRNTTLDPRRTPQTSLHQVAIVCGGRGFSVIRS